MAYTSQSKNKHGCPRQRVQAPPSLPIHSENQRRESLENKMMTAASPNCSILGPLRLLIGENARLKRGNMNAALVQN